MHSLLFYIRKLRCNVVQTLFEEIEKGQARGFLSTVTLTELK